MSGDLLYTMNTQIYERRTGRFPDKCSHIDYYGDIEEFFSMLGRILFITLIIIYNHALSRQFTSVFVKGLMIMYNHSLSRQFINVFEKGLKTQLRKNYPIICKRREYYPKVLNNCRSRYGQRAHHTMAYLISNKIEILKQFSIYTTSFAESHFSCLNLK